MTAIDADRELDGSSAGGQFLRTALDLAALKNETVRLEHVRGDRSTPGLRHQHLAVLETMAEICDADVSGSELGAETVAFDPELADGDSRATGTATPQLEGGEYAVDIGTAGSVTLLFDSLLPLATILESPLRVTATGGTDVKWSPPLDYFRHVKLPLLRRYGLTAACEVERRGFYPDGGGRTTLHLAPSTIEPIELAERGSLEDVRIYSTESESLADRDVAFRQVEGALERLGVEEREGESGSDLEIAERCETTAASPSPGSALVVRIDHGTGVAGFTALGERGKPAERVGEDAADAANRFLEREDAAPVDRHMADQLLVFLAIAGGRVRVPEVTDHVAASCELLEDFGAAIEIEGEDGDRGETDDARPATVTAEPSIGSSASR
ncbi:RNA 3'-terminal phosphate cyclase [Halopiger aswanensis]|uniref:RNA 3'-terminal phosphate cyclase n=1 Tax=Halopiger aswanensis TaxID=148449 RepID=A0A3R7FYP7_9EURY|nr:RNA 3'-terminal phosphate cyclase [Halopiger aswanensis]RKD98357.1 RNA 3'-terminal phosphate cyclase (ATP) [Halopiger aswanensis]